VIRALAVAVGVVAAFAGSVAAFAAIQSVGPEDRTGEFGFGDAARVPPGGGTLLESRNFARVVAALERELGRDGAVQTLDVRPTGATATARSGGRIRYVEIDASGRSRTRDAGAATPAALVPIARIDAGAIDRILAGVRRETRASVDSLVLQGTARQWNVRMADGEPDAFIGNLDGRGLRLPGEPDPEPVGAAPDSLLRAGNLARVLAAARKEISGAARVTALDIRPDRVTLELDANGRTLSLAYGFDAQLTSRDLRARTGDARAVSLDELDPGAVERMARSARRVAGARGLADVQYVLLAADGVARPHPELLLYLPAGHEPGYVVADLRGRGLTWPGRG
jgi:hypothetical protein